MISQRESLLLGYSPQRAFMNSGSYSSNTPNRNSDVDFHDVFGGPPRRSSISEATDSNALKRDDVDADDDEGWSGFSEKPVFGEESLNRRRTQSGNFFDDIFRGNSSVSSSPRRVHLDPFASAPGSRVLSPARPLPPNAEPSLASSLPTQFSLPATLTKGTDLQTIASTGRTTPRSRFSNQAFQSPEDSRNDIPQSSMFQEVSLSGEGSLNLDTTDKEDTGGNFEEDSKSPENPTSSSPFQFHFSIYKWASKGSPMAMPLRGWNASKVPKRSKNDEHCTNERTATESMARQSPKSTLPNIDFLSIDHPLADARSSKLECEGQENDLLLDESSSDKLEPFQFVEEATLPVVESETFSSIPNIVEDDNGNTISCHASEDIVNHSNLLQTASFEGPQKESPVLTEQVHKPELKPFRSLFFDDDLQQGNDKITKMGDRKESVVKGTKKLSTDVGSNKIAKNQTGKRSSLTKNIEVDRGSFQGSPRNSVDNLGRSKVKGKVKDFVKMFNQEVLCKPPYDGSDLGSQSSKMKEKGASKAEKEASISTTRMFEDLQKPNLKIPSPDASIMMNEDLKQLEKEYSEAKTANAPGQDVSASSTGSVPNLSSSADESSHENFQIKELTQDEKKQPQAGNNHEEIQAIDAKIRQWSRGKEGNIRSLLTTMQYVLWPESGWKSVPLVDIIEGNAVKRSYQRALLCLHPDKLQQKGASSHHKYIAAKVFDILQEAWNHFNSVGSL